MGKIEKPVVLATYSYLSDALVLRSRLEYEGISCLIPEENSASIAPHLTAMTVRILVDERDFLAAKEVLNDTTEIPSEPGDTFRCEKCGGTEWKNRPTFFRNLSRFLAGFLVSVPVRKSESRRICVKCE